MNISKKKNLFLAFAVLAGVIALSSCNRGYGCPTDFKLGNTSIEINK